MENAQHQTTNTLIFNKFAFIEYKNLTPIQIQQENF